MKARGIVVALGSIFAIVAARAPALAQWPFGGSQAEASANAAATAVRVFKLSGSVQEKAKPFDFMGGGAVIFPELLKAIAEEAAKPDVKVLVFKVTAFGAGMTQAEELAAALAAARQAGKRVIVHLESGDLRTLAATATADEIHLTPEGALFVNGLQAEVAFYRDLLGTVGLEADIEAVGQYKSAMEPFTRTTMSDAARENLDSLLDSLFASILDGVGKPRGVSRDAMEALVDKGLFTADEARKAKLVDAVSYWPEVLDGASAKAGGAAPSLAWPKPVETPSLSSIFDVMKLFGGDDEPAPAVRPKVAVLVAEGPIIDGRDPSDLFDNQSVIATEDFLDALHAIESDPLVKAVVLRISSPGGSAAASDILWRELARVGKKLPLIVSMGDVAASGGYYLASAGKKVFAGRTTLTGSIGVFGGKVVVKGLLDKVGVQTTILSRGKHAGLFSGMARFSDSEREVFRANMRHTYETFVNKVARGRSMSFDAVDKVAQGRVWSGEQAVEVGLVDKIGGLEDAVREAAKQAKLAAGDHDVTLFPKAKSFLQMFERGASGSQRIMLGAPRLDVSALLPEPLAAHAKGLARVVQGLLGKEQVLALLPFALTWR